MRNRLTQLSNPVTSNRSDQLSVTVNTNVTVSPSPEVPQGTLDLAAIGAAIRRDLRLRHRPHCRRCGYGRSGADAGILGRKRCYSCDIHAVSAIVLRLVDRVGPKEALRQLRALAPKSK
jgi:hypothetical protein